MRPWLLALSILVVFQSGTSIRADDPPVPFDPGASFPPQTVPQFPAPPPPQIDPFFAVGPQQCFDVDVLLGLPVALRVGGVVWQNERRALVLEGTAGLEVLLPFVGGGVRYRFAPYYGERDAFLIKPGLDGLYMVNPFQDLTGGHRAIFAAAVDVELAWFHNCGRTGRVGWEFGLDLGVFTNPENGWAVLPIVSVITGVRF